MKQGAKEWARDDDGVNDHVNSVESFCKLFKNSVRSTHIHVSQKYMDRYLGEFTIRANPATARTLCSIFWWGRFNERFDRLLKGGLIGGADAGSFGLIDKVV